MSDCNVSNLTAIIGQNITEYSALEMSSAMSLTVCHILWLVPMQAMPMQLFPCNLVVYT